MTKKWWNDKVCYQIYPKSFCDSNGDGIGDIRGIISKLDYLKELGVDILWLSPVYVSPFVDQGYDVADYYNIAPQFGTMEDMDELIRQVHRKGMYILMDLVLNHCSDEHEWFKRACADPEGKYGKYFYLEHTSDPSSLCNWRSYFGGSVWEKLPGHDDYYYLHLFHKKQPDLNWENPELREDIYTMINWWFDKGLDGFRLDAIINIKKALPFRNYPADRPDGLAACTRQLHDASGIGEFLGEMRDRCFKGNDAFTVGEVFDMSDDQIEDFIGENGYLSSMFDFGACVFGQSQLGWQENRDITPDDYKNCIFDAQRKYDPVGFISNIIENHDEPRGVSRYIPDGDQNPTSKKMLAAVYFMLKGLPWIYQGQELGMENLKLTSIDEVDDIGARDSYRVALEAGLTPEEALHMVEKYSRDNARTPFQWDASENAGFTAGRPWLRVNPDYKEINLADEKNDPDSVWQFYRKLVELRGSDRYKDVLVYGDFIPYLEGRHNLVAYFRKSGDRTLLVMANYQNGKRSFPLPSPVRKVILSNLESVSYDERNITLEGYQAVIMEM